jgi:hypothetical protein
MMEEVLDVVALIKKTNELELGGNVKVDTLSCETGGGPV